MANILNYSVALLIDVIVVLFIKATVANGDAFVIATVISCIIFVIWGIATLVEIHCTPNSQIRDITTIKKHSRDRKSHRKAMDEYKNEMKVELLDKYKNFETKMMSGITDSNIVATILNESGYSKTLITYNDTIKRYLNLIYTCEMEISKLIQEIKIRQGKTFYSYYWIIPKEYWCEDEDFDRMLTE